MKVKVEEASELAVRRSSARIRNRMKGMYIFRAIEHHGGRGIIDSPSAAPDSPCSGGTTGGAASAAQELTVKSTRDLHRTV